MERRVFVLGLVILGLLILGPVSAPCGALPQGDEGGGGAPRIERVLFEGNTRTDGEVARGLAGLEAGDPADPARILAAAERLRQSGLFAAVDVHTRKGTELGRVDVLFRVKERGPQLRFGAGYEDLSGWYLIPAQINLDNLTGRAETVRLSGRLGYRVGGLVLDVARRGLLLSEGSVGARLRVESQNRIYFLDGAELSHKVTRRGADLEASRALSRRLSVTAWAGVESVEADSDAVIYSDPKGGGRRRGDEIPFEDLPSAIRSGVRFRVQTRLGLSLQWDTRDGAGLARSGLWGGVSAEGILSDEGDFPSGRMDLRAQAPLCDGLQIAVRARMRAVGERAPFHERLYLGGLYTVRGFPSQSLSPPEGNLAVAAGSAELRMAWIGPSEDPLLSAVAFLDGGVGWDRGGPPLDRCSAGIGYGFRLKLPWVQLLGVDVGIPLTDGPVREAFHANGSLGWTF